MVGVVLGRDPLLFCKMFPFMLLSTLAFCAFVGVEDDGSVDDRLRMLLLRSYTPHEHG